MRQTAAALTVPVLLCHPCPSWSQGSTATLIAICDQAAASALDQSQPTAVTGVALEKIDPKIAIPVCDAAAKAAANDPRVAFQLGRAYLVAKAYESARAHFKFAADQGNAGEQNGLGLPYANGRGGLTKDDGEAARLYKLAADQGDPFAQARLCSANAGVLPEQKLESCTVVIKAGRETSRDAYSPDSIGGTATTEDRASTRHRADFARWCTGFTRQTPRQGGGRDLHLHLLQRYLPRANADDVAGAGSAWR
jgi:TPR repeat protein